MKINILNFILILSLIFNVNINAQYNVKINKQEFKISEVGFKEAWSAIKEADILFKYGPSFFGEARDYYLSAYNYNSNNAELNYKIGVCYLFTDNKFEAIKYLKKAYAAKPNVSPDIRLMLARAYHFALDFDNAILEYKAYYESLLPKQKEIERKTIYKYIEECENGKKLIENPLRVVVLNAGKEINSEFDDYANIISVDGKELYFTSRRPVNDKSKRNKLDLKYFENIYYSENVDGKWKEAQRLPKSINGKINKNNVGSLFLSPDKKTLYIYIGKENKGDIFYSEFKNNKWTKPKPLVKINSKYREASFCISKDGNTIYYVSDNPKLSIGGLDIFVVKKIGNKFSKPTNIGQHINTMYDEYAIFLADNDSTLYFSSKGHNTMGGFDIFRTKLSPTGIWSNPENIGYPINTPDDDIFYNVVSNNKEAYYATIRENSLGGFDIYKVVFLGKEKRMIMKEILNPIAGIPIKENIFFTLPEKLEIDTSLVMKGRIYDKENDKNVVAKMSIIDKEQSKVVATTISDTTGYIIKIPVAKKYGIEISARGYMLYLADIDLTGESYMKEIIKDFGIEKIEVGAKVILRNIFFEFNKATLKPESYLELENVYNFLTNNPEVKLEISGHTDNVGKYEYNLKLSTARAKAVVDYLVSRGIDPSRLTYKGYAFTQPIAPNTTEEGRALNRRVEFKVIGVK